MKKHNPNKTSSKNISVAFIIFVVLCLSPVLKTYSQVRVPFSTRTSNETPTKAIYSVKGDFTMVGNTNLTLVNYDDVAFNSNDMQYVDVDATAVPGNDTFNSSSATITFSTENGAIPECSNIIYAGLYWTGRSDAAADDNADGDNDPNTYEVTQNGITKSFDKRKVVIKGPNETNYTEITAGASGSITDPLDIAYPINGDQFNMYASYAEVTDYVRANGVGEYFVGDIALKEGIIDAVGYYGGWGMVIIYENSKMNYRDITLFDGYAFMDSTNGSNEIDVSGFNPVQSGDVNIKLGLMAGEGDVAVPGDYFEMLIPDGDDDPNDLSTLNNNNYQRLSHSSNTADNFFNSSINTGGNPRNPNVQNNTGLDVVMFNIDNTGNNLIANDQTYTRFSYGSTVDTYIIFNVVFSVDAYIPETEGVLNITSVNGAAPNPPDVLEPGEDSSYLLEIRNTGTEETDNTTITVPLPDSIDANSLNITFNTYFTPTPVGVPVYDPTLGSNGSIIWNLGTLPVPADSDTVLADISFSLTVTADCNTLSNPGFDSNVTLNGSISGTGAISNIDFDYPLILGYERDGLCQGEPILAPIVIVVDFEDYINEPPAITAPTPLNIEGCDESNLTAINVRYPYSATQSADIKSSFVAPSYTASDNGAIESITYIDVIDPDTSCGVEINRTFTITDDCGNLTDVEQTITVTNTAPATIPENDTNTVNCISDATETFTVL